MTKDKDENALKEESLKKTVVTLTYPCTNILDNPTEPDVSFSLSLPMKTLEKTKALLANTNDVDTNASEELRRWVKAFDESVNKYINGNSFKKSLEREGGDWRQEVVTETGEKVRISTLTGKGKDGGNKLSGDNALVMLNRALEIGTVVKVPLWHSGFWVTIKAPTSATLIAVDRVMATEKIILGRQTNGMVFSNVSVYLRKTLIDLILGCIVSTSIQDYKKNSLKELILLSDYQTLLWGLVCSNHPNGYKLVQPCISNLDVCNFVATERVMLSKLSWVDNDRLTSDQKSFVQNQKQKKVKKEDILEYQRTVNRPSEIRINDNLSLTLATPNLKVDIVTGIRWVDSLVNKVDELFSDSEITDDIKNMRILEQSKASALRQYASWINLIAVGSDSGEDKLIIDDRLTIDSACESLTADSKICKQIFEEIGKYIDDSIISIIGIPSYTCPKCETPQTDHESHHPEIIPLAIDDIFFTLIRQWTNRLIAQENIF